MALNATKKHPKIPKKTLKNTKFRFFYYKNSRFYYKTSPFYYKNPVFYYKFRVFFTVFYHKTLFFTMKSLFFYFKIPIFFQFVLHARGDFIDHFVKHSIGAFFFIMDFTGKFEFFF
jgi:hypothetical protein